MSRKSKTTTKNAARNRARVSNSKEPRSGTKLETIGKLLAQKNGCTTSDVLEETKWPSVSMPQQAKALGITLHKKKIDGVTRYADHAIAS